MADLNRFRLGVEGTKYNVKQCAGLCNADSQTDTANTCIGFDWHTDGACFKITPGNIYQPGIDNRHRTDTSLFSFRQTRGHANLCYFHPPAVGQWAGRGGKTGIRRTTRRNTFLLSQPGVTADDCATFCFDDQSCTGFDYQTSTETCWKITSDGASKTVAVNDTDFVAYDKNPLQPWKTLSKWINLVNDNLADAKAEVEAAGGEFSEETSGIIDGVGTATTVYNDITDGLNSFLTGGDPCKARGSQDDQQDDDEDDEEDDEAQAEEDAAKEETNFEEDEGLLDEAEAAEMEEAAAEIADIAWDILEIALFILL
jgi:hypothetical protein